MEITHTNSMIPAEKAAAAQKLSLIFRASMWYDK
jgi:hypothetical protein